MIMVSPLAKKKQIIAKPVRDRKAVATRSESLASDGNRGGSLPALGYDDLKSGSSRQSGRKPKRRKTTSEPFEDCELNAQLYEFTRLIVCDDGDEGYESLREELCSKKFDFIGNSAFEIAGAESEILGATLFYDTDGNGSVNSSARFAALPSYLARLCEARLLKPELEVNLFRRMNYLQHVANKFMAGIVPESLTHHDLLCVKGLIAAANWYRDLIVKSNMRLVISIVKKFANPNNPFDDLLSDGIMALIRAVEKFDFERGFRFSTYATQVVRRNAYRNVMTKQKDRVRFGTSLQEADVDLDDRYSAAGMSPETWHLLRTKLVSLLDKLDRREKFIVRARFSLGGHRKVQTLQKIADSLGVSKERIRQLEKRALDKLRDLASLLEFSEFGSE